MVHQEHDRPSTYDRNTKASAPPEGPRRSEARRTPTGQRVVASFGTYPEAERAVDYLSDRRFPVRQVAIVGRGLSSVEQVTGRLTVWGAAGRSALSGAIIGVLFGWLFGLFNWINPVISAFLVALYGLIFGAVVGAVFGLIGHAVTGGRRDFSSVAAMRADRYDVLVDAEVADEATHLLAEADESQLRG
jgi:hypothetical protein